MLRHPSRGGQKHGTEQRGTTDKHSRRTRRGRIRTRHRQFPPWWVGKTFGLATRKAGRAISEKPKRGEERLTSIRGWRSLQKQVNLILADMLWAEAIWRTVEVFGEIPYGVDIGPNGV